MSCLSDSSSHMTSTITDRQPPGIYNSLKQTLYIYINSSTRKHLLHPIPELYGVQTSADMTVFNLRRNYKMSFKSNKRCLITRTNSAVFTINRHKKVNTRFTELRFLSNPNVMSLVGFGGNKWGGLETTLLEAVDRNKWNASKRLGLVVDYVPIGDNTAQEEF